MRPSPPDVPKRKNPLARIHSPGVMMLLVLLLVIYLIYVLADSFGLEGEGGWQSEVISAAIFVAGIIFAAVVVAGSVLALRKLLSRRRGEAPWVDDEETE